MRHLLFALLLGLPRTADSQAVFEDGKGRTSLIAAGIGSTVFDINTGNASFQIGAYHVTNTSNVIFGAVAEAKAVEGTAALFSGGDVSPGAAATLTFGLKPIRGQNDMGRVPNWRVMFRARPSWAEIALVHPTSPDTPVIKKTIQGVDFGVSFQYPVTSRLWVGTGVGRRYLNNYAELRKAVVTTTTTRNAANGSAVTISRQSEAKTGTFADADALFFDADALFQVYHVISTRAFVRVSQKPDELPGLRNSMGIDVGVHKLGGDVMVDRAAAVVFELVQELDSDEDDDDINKRLKISLVADVRKLITTLTR
jgi:hypothetical protein